MFVLIDFLTDYFAAHYAQYFKIKVNNDDPTGPVDEVVFDWNALKEAGKSFIDSIILELCFPRAPYPMTVLYQILRDAVDESPKEAKRFPQALWDAVGDLSVTQYHSSHIQMLTFPSPGIRGTASTA